MGKLGLTGNNKKRTSAISVPSIKEKAKSKIPVVGLPAYVILVADMSVYVKEI